MACLYINSGRETDLDNYIACLVSEVRTKIDGLNTTLNVSATQTRSLINATTSNLARKVDSSRDAINTNVNNSTNRVTSQLSYVQGQIQGSVGNAVTNLTNNMVNSAANVIRSVGTRLDQIRSESQALQNLTVQSVNANANNQTLAILQSIQSTGDSIKSSISTAGDGVGGFVDSVTRGIQDFIQDIIDALLSIFQPFIDWLNGEISSLLFNAGKILSNFATQVGAFTTNYQEIVRRVEYGEYDDLDRLIDDLKITNIDLGFYRSLVDVATLIPLIVQMSTGGFRAFSKQLGLLTNTEFRPEILSPPESLQAYNRGLLTQNQLFEELAKNGLSDDRIYRLIALSKTLLDGGTVTRARLREFIGEDDYQARLKQLGYDEPERAVISQLRNLLPPIQDLITMAVREAFSPEIADLFGQYQDYPQKLSQYASQQGLTDEWARAYWASHWSLPSPSQGFEMLHRGIIDKETLKQLLRALDIMPYWRDKVIELSYTPLRLVDIRRFYEDGVINQQEMFNEYKSRGYDDKHALWATNWTIQYTSKGNEQERAEHRLLSQAVIVKALNAGKMTRDQAIDALISANYTRENAALIIDLYTTKDELDNEENVLKDNKARITKLASDGYGNRVISRSDADEMLREVGYSQEQANIELESVDYEYDNRLRAHLVDYYKELYTNYSIDQNELTNSLGFNGFQPGEISRLLNEFNIIRETRVKKPTFEQITRWFKKGIIQLEEYVIELKGLGYSDVYIDRFVRENT